MIGIASRLPTRRPDLVIRPVGTRGRFVVKHPDSGQFFEIGEQEHFLLTHLDAATDRDSLLREFEGRFGQPLAADDVEDFVGLAEQQGLLCDGGTERRSDRESAVRLRKAERQSILYWRKKLVDPDAIFTWLEPGIRFCWSFQFIVLVTLSILSAIWLVWIGRQDLVESFHSSLRWESAVLAWFTLLVVIALHECAHGLTCKHFGGEVREIGFLLMFFMPCFYCNVSDAWLFPEKSKRLWVTFAGGFFELFVWSLSVFVWRLTVPGSLVNYLAFIVLSLCGIQSLFNFLPLLKLDGYYLLSDWLEVPNLRQRALERWRAWLRRTLWGAPALAPEPKGRFLTLFGLASWAFSLVFMGLMLAGLGRWLGDHLGPPGVVCVAVLGVIVVCRMLRGIAGGEVANMLRLRRWRTMVWLGALAWGGSALCFWKIEDRAGGTFQLRSTVRAEIRAPVSGFLREVCVAEGQPVSAGARVLRLEIPELTSQLAQKQAELAEAQAGLCLLEAGTRPEELRAQQRRIDSARTWRDVALKNLDHAREALQSQLAGLDGDIARAHAELDAAHENLTRAESLQVRLAISSKDFEAARLRVRAAQAACDKAAADRRAVASRAVLLVELEVAEREHDLASLESSLTVMEAGSRPEEISAQEARVSRLREELHELQERHEQLIVCSPVGGLVTTPRFRDKVGSHFQAGELILLVEDLSSLEAEVRLDEQAVRRVHDGQTAMLRPRAVPLQKVSARVRRVADAAEPADAATSASHVRVDCRIDGPTDLLRPGMSGYARINTGKRSVGAILVDRILRHLKAEYWW